MHCAVVLCSYNHLYFTSLLHYLDIQPSRLQVCSNKTICCHHPCTFRGVFLSCIPSNDFFFLSSSMYYHPFIHHQTSASFSTAS